MGFRFDVVNRLCCRCPSTAFALLTEMFVTRKDAGASDIPLASISSLMPALSGLMLLPALIEMVSAVT